MKARVFGIVLVVVLVLALILFIVFNDSIGKFFGNSSVANAPTQTGKPASSSLPAMSSSPGAAPVVSNSPPKSSSIYINEIVSSNRASVVDERYGSPDWIELYNPTNAAVNLENFALSDEEKKPAKYLFPAKTSIPSHGYLLVYAAKLIPDAPVTVPVTDFRLASGGLTLFLTSAGGDLLQKFSVPALATDISYAYDGKSAYRLNNKPTPGQANSDSFVSEKAITAMPDSAPLTITEVLLKNTYSIADGQGDRSPWVEITNNSQSPVHLADYRLSDNKDKFDKWAFPESELAAGERMVVFCSGKGAGASRDGELHTDFKLGSGDTGIYLTDVVNMQQQSLAVTASMKDNVSYGLQDGKWLYFSQPTPGAANTSKGYDSLTSLKPLDRAGIWINEVATVQSRGSSGMDWIEIANGGPKSVSLKGYYLSNSTNDFKKYKLGDITIPAGGYKVINASATKSQQKGGVATFGLSVSGETLVLSSPQGYPLDIFNTGVLRPGYSSGRVSKDDSGEKVLFGNPTPGNINSSPAGKSFTAQPVFSVPGGYYNKQVQVSITCDTPDAKIYYTLDGSTPTQNSKLYAGPITVTANRGVQGCPVRAIAYSSGAPQSDVQTATYLFDKKRSVPVVCLSMSPSDFRTIYANTQRLRNVERPGYVEYYDENKLGISFPCASMIRGWTSRGYAQKGFSFKLASGYGASTVTYPFFEDYPLTTFSSLDLRAAGQDRWSTYFRDAYFSRVGLQIGQDSSANTWAVLYVNGEYRGLYDIREDICKNTFAAKHNVDPDTINYVRRNSARAGSADDIKRVRNYANSHDLSNDKYYDEFCQWVDAQAWCDYLVMNNYFPSRDLFNQKCWSTNDYKVKIRPVLFDLDFSLLPGGLKYGFIPEYFIGQYFSPHDHIRVDMSIPAGLFESPKFREMFVERYAELMNTVFKPDNLLPLFDKMQKEMEPEIADQIKRWGDPSSVAAWKQDMKQLRQMIIDRPKYAKQQLKNRFSLSDAKMKELFPG